MKTLLLTWAMGYIGSHAIVAFEQAWYKTVTIDNLSNSSRETLLGIEKILWFVPDFYEGDIRDREFLVSIFEQYEFDAVIHFAGLKAVGESCDEPFKYYHANIEWSICLFEVMEEYGVRKIIFSSSATVYRSDNESPLNENMALGTTNPYGTTKLVIEQILQDLATQKEWSVSSLRYFNPIGAHPSGYIGEVPRGTPNNLFPYILDVARGVRSHLNIYGNDYDTPDGTGVRDYIDVCDLVDAHILAYKKMQRGYEAINIGMGQWTSVLEMIYLTEGVLWKSIPYTFSPRRPGDLATVYCDASYAHDRLNWKATRSISESIENWWRFIQNQ